MRSGHDRPELAVTIAGIRNKGFTQKSPMAATETYWQVRTEESLGGYSVPFEIAANLHIPNAVAGHNVLHGTSVFAAAVAAFHLQRIWMASCGVPCEELDKLTLNDVLISGVTLTYLLQCQSEAEARRLVLDIFETGKGLYGDSCSLESSSNDTVYIKRGEYEITIYNKTNFSHCAFKPGTPVRSLLELSPTIVRIEVKMGTRFLRKNGFMTVESWKQAYADGTYEKLFNSTVRKTLRLDGECLRHKLPREQVFAKLTPIEAHILREYLKGLDPRVSKAVAESARPNNRFYELRKALLHKAQVDIDIPWSIHKTLKCYQLVDKLFYPGDYEPSSEYADWSFCRSNWESLLKNMISLYDEAIASVAQAKMAPTSNEWN